MGWQTKSWRAWGNRGRQTTGEEGRGQTYLLDVDIDTLAEAAAGDFVEMPRGADAGVVEKLRGERSAAR